MIKVYKDNVVLSIEDNQINDYKKRGFKVAGEKETKEDTKVAKKVKELEEKIQTLETEKAELETKVATLETEKAELEKAEKKVEDKNKEEK